MENMIPDEFLFTVESNGALKPQRIVVEAVKILKKRLGVLKAKIDADELHDPISEFDFSKVDEGKLFSIRSGDDDDEEEGTTGDIE